MRRANVPFTSFEVEAFLNQRREYFVVNDEILIATVERLVKQGYKIIDIKLYIPEE